MTDSQCPICSTRLNKKYEERLTPSTKNLWCGCARCGHYCFSVNQDRLLLDTMQKALGEYEGNWDSDSILKRSKLSHQIQRRYNQSKEYISFDKEQLEQWATDETLPNPAEQLDNLILWAGENQVVGTITFTNPNRLSALVGCAISRSMITPLDWLLKQPETKIYVTSEDCISDSIEFHNDPSSLKLAINLNMAGWARYEELKRGRTASRTAFMAMKFHEDTKKPLRIAFAPPLPLRDLNYGRS